jgi:hypothetical protein
MFTIDLLKGAGKPPQSRPLWTAGVALAFTLLIAAGALDGLRYYRGRTLLTLQQRTLAYYNGEIQELQDVAQSLDAAKKREGEIDVALAEVNKALATHATWSGVLLALSQGASKEIGIPDIMAKREEKGTGDQLKYVRMLMVGVVSPSGPAAVEQFVRTLRLGLPLQSGPDSIRIISQRQEMIAGQPLQYYVIECQLKM